MKKLSLLIASILFAYNSFSQTTNIVEQNGNVGIGINPLYKLHIQGNHGNSQLLLHSIGGHTEERMADLFLWASEPGLTYSGTGIGNNVINVSSAPYLKRINDKRGGSYIRLLDGEIRMNIIKNDGSDINTISILNSGFVGIGTKTPKAKLDVNGSILIPSGVNGGAYFKYSYTSKSTNSRSWIVANDFYHYGDFGIYQSINQTDDNLQNFIHNYRFYINRDGNVGIGTITTGTHKLAVEGTIGAREIKVEAAAWSDFVFEENYQLKDLEEVESYIKENKHLPDVPSEKEVLENGIQLGEMDAKLLQKIEELTLYVIEQNKTMKAQNKKIQTLNERINTLEVQ